MTIGWGPVYYRISGNEKADELAKAAASRAAPSSDDSVPGEFRWEASLSQMNRSATEATPRDPAERIPSHASAEAPPQPGRYAMG